MIRRNPARNGRQLDPLVAFLFVTFASLGLARAETDPEPFVVYPEPVGAYLKRIQAGERAFAFPREGSVETWRHEAREALIDLIGLSRMRNQLAAFRPSVDEGAEEKRDGFTRRLCWIETEPDVQVPFYLLVPDQASEDDRRPLFLAPHGHDLEGLHSYAGAFKDPTHEARILEKEGNIVEQAARRGFVAIAPATRGLAAEVLTPDPQGRHGSRPCRAQLIHCLIGGRTAIAERVWDMQCILDWATERRYIDRDQVVMTGNSGGGVLTAYTAAIDERVQVAIPSCSFTAIASPEGYVFHCDCCLVPGIRDWGDWDELAGLIAPRSLLVVHGEKDGLHHRPTIDALGERIARVYATSRAKDRFDLQWGAEGHRFYPDLMWPFIERSLR